MTTFEIHELRVSAGVLALSGAPGRAGNFKGDLNTIMLWQPDLVLSLTETPELAKCGATGLGPALIKAGVAWQHLPITDFGIPIAQDNETWAAAIADAQHRLTQGQRILVHCYGGCGRSGMVVLRLMIASGEPATTALTRLRALRPCAIETPEQMSWAHRG